MTGTAIVTGAGTGIGKASALALLEAGWNVVFAGRRAELLEAAVAEAPDAGGAAAGDALAHACDVTKPDEVDGLFETAVAKFGRVDLLFNNAGTGLIGSLIDEIEPEEWNRVVNVNLTGAFLCARAAFRLMRTQSPKGGRII
ncbi:MAG: SDR family oxidoreductase, partial [Bauldia litoralis]